MNLLEEVFGNFYRFELLDEDGVEIPHAMLMDPDDSAGLCVVASEAAVEFLEEHEIQAQVVDGRDPYGYGTAHTWVECEVDDIRYRVDLTAAQYGRDEFPLIEKI